MEQGAQGADTLAHRPFRRRCRAEFQQPARRPQLGRGQGLIIRQVVQQRGRQAAVAEVMLGHLAAHRARRRAAGHRQQVVPWDLPLQVVPVSLARERVFFIERHPQGLEDVLIARHRPSGIPAFVIGNLGIDALRVRHPDQRRWWPDIAGLAPGFEQGLEYAPQQREMGGVQPSLAQVARQAQQAQGAKS